MPSARESLIEMMQEEGYDLLTAASYVAQAIEDFKASGDSEITLVCGKRTVTLRNSKPTPPRQPEKLITWNDDL